MTKQLIMPKTLAKNVRFSQMLVADGVLLCLDETGQLWGGAVEVDEGLRPTGQVLWKKFQMPQQDAQLQQEMTVEVE